MRTRARRRVRVGAVLAACLLGVAIATAGDLEGRWTMTRQTYENGAGNLADPSRALLLEFAADGVVEISPGDGTTYPWPVFADDEGPLPLEMLERSVDLPGGAVRVRYRVRPAAGDPLVLDVVESYRVETDGDVLSGTMTVAFVRDGKPRGEYVLHRRFEREP